MNKDNLPDRPYNGKTYAYVAIGLCALGAVSFGLTFTILGIYALIASVLLALASLSFVNIQKRKNNFDWLIIIKVCALVLLCVAIAFFIGGIIWSAIN